MLSDIYGIMPAINQAIKNVKKWSKPEKKSSNFPFGLIGAKSYIKYEPLGTVGMISPWNFPVNLTFVPLVSIFAAGNQVMHKPSEHTPTTSLLLKELCDKSFDQNEFATFLGGPEVGESFTNLSFDHLLYTGGGAVAKHVMASASKNLVPCTLELGGKSPTIIFPDADIDAAIAGAASAIFFNHGQCCCAGSRLMAHEKVFDQVAEGISKIASNIKVGPGMDSSSEMGPLVSDEQFKKVSGYIESGKSEGGEIIAGGKYDNSSGGNFVHPTVFAKTDKNMSIVKEEIFGPVLTMIPYKSEEEAIAIANDTDYGLAGYVQGGDLDHARDVAAKIRAGNVHLNGAAPGRDLPFGGYNSPEMAENGDLTALRITSK